MEILRTIALYVEGKDMPFLVIGGHAVNSYGLSRQTGDLDLLVRERDRQAWIELMAKLHLKAGQSDDRFARFRPEVLTGWPIDLMFVDEETFAKMFDASAEVSFGPARAHVAAARHLVALKLHALKQGQEHRFAKDVGDIIGLLRSGRTGLTREELQAMCIRYATPEWFEKLKDDVPRS
jgi:hypothetical protein